MMVKVTEKKVGLNLFSVFTLIRAIVDIALGVILYFYIILLIYIHSHLPVSCYRECDIQQIPLHIKHVIHSQMSA